MSVPLERLIVQSVLDLLVVRAAEVLPDFDVAVRLMGRGMHGVTTAASTLRAGDFEQAQVVVGQGPTLTASRDDVQVHADDLQQDQRFVGLAHRARLLGAAAAYSFPLRHGSSALGALTFTRAEPGAMSRSASRQAQDLADVAAAHLPSARTHAAALSVSEGFRVSALHDALTGLPNRLLLQQRLDHAAQRAERSHGRVAVLFADLDRFKSVNDTYGHTVGDGLLVAVAGRLQALVRPGDTLARVSGDEFVFLCEDLVDGADGELLAARIAEALTQPFLVEGIELHASASVGIAYAGPGEAVTSHLIVNADIAMYQAKRQGGGVHRIIDLRDAKDVQERTLLEQDLHGASARAELSIAYQPVVRSQDGVMTGVEALLRWTHPVLGPVPALTAVGTAEHTGLIIDIGSWVLERSCLDRRRWLAQNPGSELSISVNVSALQLMSPGFARLVSSTLVATRTDPGALVLELTEGILIDDADRALEVLRELKSLGVRLALDDFGSGYCSLGYLKRFPVDIVKIDQQFVADIGNDTTGRAIVAAVTTLAHVLGMQVTAEGVETGQQRDEVAAIGCENAQGFFYARPMSGDALAKHLAEVDGQPLRLPLLGLQAVRPHAPGAASRDD